MNITNCSVYVILVRSKYAKNIGACARALANMGDGQLILIDPQCDITYSTHESAAGAQTTLRNHKTYDSLSSFFAEAPHGYKIGLSARSGKKRPTIELNECLDTINDNKKPYFFVFGPEDHGLSSDETNQLDRVTFLPTYSGFKSLNLSQAVLLTLYIFRNKTSLMESEPVSFESSELLSDDLISDWFQALGYEVEDYKKKNAMVIFKNIIQQGHPDPEQVKFLNHLIHHNIRKLSPTSFD